MQGFKHINISQNYLRFMLLVAMVVWAGLWAPLGGLCAQTLTSNKINAAAITADQAPQIDGDLSDPAWARASLVDKFTQIDPVFGGLPSEPTHIRIMYTDSHLYIGAKMFESDLDKITARVMTRDTNVDLDDYIQIFIDSYGTARDSHFFMVSPTGARREGLTENNRKFAPEWDTIWDAKTSMDDDGWSAEIAIPFRSFGYDVNLSSWGFQIRRKNQARNEDTAWIPTSQALPDFDVSSIGELGGISGTQIGRGLDVQGFVTASSRYDWKTETLKTKLDPSANIFYRFTPSLTGTLTLNTDFSDTPLDPRQVNTNRFSLFFPETREFFLQDQNLFAFGGRALRSPNGLPFFSRRIGIVGGTPVDIKHGAKLSGSVGDVNIGALTVNTGEADALTSQDLSVVRSSFDIGDGSRIGFIATDGDPRGGHDNTVWGLDGQYKTTTLIPGKQFAADAYYLKSESSLESRTGESYGFEIAYPNDLLNGFIRAKHLDETYAPALGFVNRPGIRDYDGQIRFRKRYKDSAVRYDSLGFYTSVETNLSGSLETAGSGAFLQRVWQDGSSGFLFGQFFEDVLHSSFTLPGGAVLPAGSYDWNNGIVVYDTGRSKNWRLRSEVECCDFYDGRGLILDFDAEYRPSKHLNFEASYRFNDISVPGGKTEIHVFSGDVIVNITPDMQISNQIQYDNISEGLGYFGRFRWAIRGQTELLVTLSHGVDTDFETFRAVQTGLSIRLGNTYRF